MFNLKTFFENHKILISFISIFSLLRIYIGTNIPIWFSLLAKVDDLLLIDYSYLNNHFTHWNIYSLVKNLSYSLFLSFVRVSGLPYRFWLSILWIIAALLIVYAVYKFLTKDNRVLIILFLFILFSPVAFDVEIGLRVYRNALLAPCSVIFLASLYIFINQLFDFSNNKMKSLLFWSIFSGLTFTFSYYIKEDGIITLPIFLISILFVLILIIYINHDIFFKKQNFTKIIKIMIIASIPVIIFAGSTVCYEEINNHYFGVAETNTRVSGEMGEFYSNLLKIEDDSKTSEIWIPASTVQKAYNASPTFHNNTKLFDEWMNLKWANKSLKDSEMPGDHPTWSLRVALNQSGMFNDEKSASELFYNINNELEQAFDNGSLDKSDKIFITSSAPGKSIDEIFELTPNIFYGLKATLLYDGFNYENKYYDGTTLFSDNTTKGIESDLNDQLITYQELNNTSFLDEIPLDFVLIDGIIYQITSIIFVILSFLGFFSICWHQLKHKFKNHNLNMMMVFGVLLLGTILVQIFAVSWFCTFLSFGSIKNYLASTYGFYLTFVSLFISAAYNILKNYKLNKDKPKVNTSMSVANSTQIRNTKPAKYNEPSKHNISEMSSEDVIDLDSIDAKIIEEIVKEIKMERKK